MATIDRRRSKNGQTTWRARIRRKGITVSESFDRREKAQRWALEVERAIERGDWLDSSDPGELRFEKLVDYFLVARESRRESRTQLKWWTVRLGSEWVGSITRRRVLRLRESLIHQELSAGRHRSPATVNRYLSALSALFTWALARGWVEHHPVRGIAPLEEGGVRVRFLNDDECDRLLESCLQCGGSNLQALVTLAISTGARRGELLALRWSDIDLQKRRVTMGDVGEGRSRDVAARSSGGRYTSSARQSQKDRWRRSICRSPWRRGLPQKGLGGRRCGSPRSRTFGSTTCGIPLLPILPTAARH